MAFKGYVLCYRCEEDEKPITPLLQDGGRMWVFGNPEPAYKALSERRQSLYKDAELSMESTGFIFNRKKVHTKSSRIYTRMAETLDVVPISIFRGHRNESDK